MKTRTINAIIAFILFLLVSFYSFLIIFLLVSKALKQGHM